MQKAETMLRKKKMKNRESDCKTDQSVRGVSTSHIPICTLLSGPRSAERLCDEHLHSVCVCTFKVDAKRYGGSGSDSNELHALLKSTSRQATT